MPPSKPISAEQAAQAIVLLSSKHDTASAYLYSMDGENMSRTEFTDYLRTSSQEEYLDLLRGHLPDECATLVTKAAELQGKRKEKGQALAGWQLAKETARQFFDTLELKKSQGLRFKDVRKAMKSIPAQPSTPKPKAKAVPTAAAQTNKSSSNQQVSASQEAQVVVSKPQSGNATNKGEKKDMIKPGKEQETVQQNEQNEQKTKSRKELRQEEFAAQQAKLAKRQAKKARHEERRKQLSAGGRASVERSSAAIVTKSQTHLLAPPQATESTHSRLLPAASKTSSDTTAKETTIAEENKKKRKHDAVSENGDAVQKAADTLSDPNRRKRERRKARKVRDAAFVNKIMTTAPKVERIADRDDGTDETVPAAKKRKTAHASFDKTGSLVTATQAPSQGQPVGPPIASAQEGHAKPGALAITKDGDSIQAAEKSERNRVRREKRRQKKMLHEKTVQQTSAQPSDVKDVEMVDEESSVPAPTQETTEFVSAVEPEDPFNNQSGSSNASTPKMFRPGRTLLPVLEPKTWTIESSTQAIPQPSMTEPEIDEDESISDAVSAHTPRPASPRPASGPSSSPTSSDIDAPTPKSVATSQSGSPRAQSAQDSPSIEANGDLLHSSTVATEHKSASTPKLDKSEVDESEGFVTASNGSSPAISKNPPVVNSHAAPVSNEAVAVDAAKSANQSHLIAHKSIPSSQRAKPSSGRPTMGIGYMGLSTPTLSSLGRMVPFQMKANSIPTQSSDVDPQTAFRNLNKFLNNGNSSDESDDESSESSDDESPPPPKSKIAHEPEQKNEIQSQPQSAQNGPEQPTFSLNADEAANIEDGKDEQSDLEVLEVPEVKGTERTPNGLLSFGSFHDNSTQLSQEPSPSPEIPDLPALMDQGGYVPHFSSGGHANTVLSDHPASDNNDAMDIDILSPLKNHVPAQGPAEGTLHPSEVVDSTSSPPYSSAPAIEDEMEIDELQHSLGSHSTNGSVAHAFGADEIQEDSKDQLPAREIEISVMDRSEDELDRQNEEIQRSCAESSALLGKGHHTDDDQAMASSQLLGEEAGAEPPSQDARSSQPVARSQSPQVASVRSSENDLAGVKHLFEAQPLDDSDDGSESSSENENEREVDSDKNEIQQSIQQKEHHEFMAWEVAHLMRSDSPSSMEWNAENNGDGSEEVPAPSTTEMKEHKKRKSTGTTSRHFSATPEKKIAKRVAGVSSVPFPKLSAPHFGLIQEKLWHNPFQMLCAVLFLNKTNGHVAKDTILQVIEQWPTPGALAEADRDVLLAMVEGLGLQNERTKKLIKLAETFVTDPPRKARRHRTLHYPAIGDGKTTRDGKKTSPNQILDEDFDEIEGFLEIGHLYGAGPYAYDSWRIFCRDVLRGVADGYNGEGVEGYNVSDPKSQCTFEPEWKRVVPLDKELRACLRWMWLREGWDWNPLTGKKIPASVSKIRDASQGVAAWEEPVPFNPHGIMEGSQDPDAEGSQGSEALLPGVKGEDVLETTEQPRQGTQDGLIEEAPVVARTTRRSCRNAKAGRPTLSQESTQSSQLLSRQSTQSVIETSQTRIQTVKRISQESVPNTKATPQASTRRSKALSQQFTQDEPLSTSQVDGQSEEPSKKSDKDGLLAGLRRRRSLRDLESPRPKAKPALVVDVAAQFPLHASQPNLPAVPDSPSKNTRLRASRVVESNIQSSPPRTTRATSVEAAAKVHGMSTRARGGNGIAKRRLSCSVDDKDPFPFVFPTSVSFVADTKSHVQRPEPFQMDEEDVAHPVMIDLTLDSVDGTFPTLTDTTMDPVVSAEDVVEMNVENHPKRKRRPTKMKKRIEKEQIVMQPKPGFFDEACDEASSLERKPGREECSNGVPSEEETLEPHALARAHAREVSDKAKGYGTDPTVKGPREAEQAAAAEARGDPMRGWREHWKRIYLQDHETAVQAAKKGTILRSRPKKHDREAWPKIQEIEPPPPTPKEPSHAHDTSSPPKRPPKWESLSTADLLGSSPTRHFKKGLGLLEHGYYKQWCTSFAAKADTDIPAHFVITCLEWLYKLSLSSPEEKEGTMMRDRQRQMRGLRDAEVWRQEVFRDEEAVVAAQSPLQGKEKDSVMLEREQDQDDEKEDENEYARLKETVKKSLTSVSDAVIPKKSKSRIKKDRKKLAKRERERERKQAAART